MTQVFTLTVKRLNVCHNYNVRIKVLTIEVKGLTVGTPSCRSKFEFGG